MKIVNYLIILSISFLLVSCSKVSEPIKKASIGSRVINYQPSENVDSLIIPPDLTKPSSKGTFSEVIEEDDDFNVLTGVQNIEVVRDQYQRWLLVELPPAEVLNLTKEFSIKGLNFYEIFTYSLKFFFFNFIDILYAITGFYYIENYAFKLILFTTIIALMILGLINLYKTKDTTLFSFFLFIIIGFVGWIVMVLIQKFPLSPTRHSLILLPILVILITSGIGFLLKKININSYLKMLLIPFIFSVFLINYSTFYKNRISSFSEEEISNLIDKYSVDTLFLLDYTMAPILMQKLELPIYYYGNWINERYIHKNQNKICFLSHRSNIEINRAIKTYNNAIFFNHDNSKKLSNKSLSLLYSKEITSNVEMEFGNMVKDATNSFYLYIYELK